MTDTFGPKQESTSKSMSDSDSNIIQTAKGGGISFLGQLFVFVFRFIFGLILARVLGAELLGLYSLTLTITDVIAVIALLGLGSAIVRYIPIAINQKDDARLWGIIQVGVFVPFVVSFYLRDMLIPLRGLGCHQYIQSTRSCPSLAYSKCRYSFICIDVRTFFGYAGV